MRPWLTVLLMMLVVSTAVRAADSWPMWRHDAMRSAISTAPVPDNLALRWELRLPTPQPAWPESQTKLRFDATYRPVSATGLLFVASMVDDSISAYSASTGREQWRFFTSGPVRFAPAFDSGRLFAASDDGSLYCLDALTGALIWRFSGAPSNRLLLGNGRMISAWCARGGPVIAGNTVYFAAGIWPFMGTFIYAIDTSSGRMIWRNSGTGSRFTVQPHGSPAFAGFAPQGYMSIAGDILVAAGGRTPPAGFNLTTGKLLYFDHSVQTGRDGGGFFAAAAGNFLSCGDALYYRNTGHGARSAARGIYDATFSMTIGTNAAELVMSGPPTPRSVTNLDGKVVTSVPILKLFTSVTTPGVKEIFLKAGSRYYCSFTNGTIGAVIPGHDGSRILWSTQIKGRVLDMLASEGRLFAVTDAGTIFCFSAEETDRPDPVTHTAAASADSPEWAQRTGALLAGRSPDGYAFVPGAGSGAFIRELIRQSRFHIVVLETDSELAGKLRREFAGSGLYGTRVSIIDRGSITDFPKYFAELVASESLLSERPASESLSVLRNICRPYSGTLAVKGELIQAEGPLKGAGSWTQQYMDASQSICSADALVKAPLGLLWFGGPPNDPILPRHGHGPMPQVAGGRLFIEGADLLRAVDVYTGRVLWERQLPGLGRYFNNTHHHPGANETGANFASTPDAVYVLYSGKCLKLDPSSGKTGLELTMPAELNGMKNPRWGNINISGDLLIAAAGPVAIPFQSNPALERTNTIRYASFAEVGPMNKLQVENNADQGAASRALVVFDRHTGKILWSRNADVEFRHNAICAGGGKIFCLDGTTRWRMKQLHYAGQQSPDTRTIYALDALTGNVDWKCDTGAFGTWLAYSATNNVLIEAGSSSRDTAADESNRGIRAFNAADGMLLWTRTNEPWSGPPVLHPGMIISQARGAVNLVPALDGYALDYKTGGKITVKNPLTGGSMLWGYSRGYGCNTAIGSENLLTFRSGAAAYFPLDNPAGTVSLGGFKSGCTPNLIAADGVLSAPDYTRTCVCSFQNQSSLAFIHDPQAETWSFFPFDTPTNAVVTRLGINFGAPGSMRTSDGTFWLPYPPAGGPVPYIPMESVPAAPQARRSHALLADSTISASCVEGMESFTVTLNNSVPFTARMHFAEPAPYAKPGDRVFSLFINGRKHLTNLDIMGATGKPLQDLIREVKGITPSDGRITFSFTSQRGTPVISGVELIAE